MVESTLLEKGACPDCSSSDACATYDDGHTHCFSCDKTTQSDDTVAERVQDNDRSRRSTLTLLEHDPKAIPKRKISQEVCRSHGYGIGQYRGQPCQVADYRDPSGHLVAQKVKMPGKQFTILGDAKAMTLWQQWRWPGGGKHLIVTEGETDTLAYQTASGDKFACVSVPNGASAAKKAIASELEWVESFGRVVFMFDMDEPGRKAAEECALLLTPGKAAIGVIPDGHKDICEATGAGAGLKVVKAFWNAKIYRPDGIVDGFEIWDAMQVYEDDPYAEFPWAGLQDKLGGIRRGRMYLFTSGSGCGKSTLMRQLNADLLDRYDSLKGGMVALEEGLGETGLELMSMLMGQRLALLSQAERPLADMEKVWQALDLDNRFFSYSHFGCGDEEGLVAKLRYMRVALGVDYAVLDHISIVVSASEDDDERKMIDRLMTKLRKMVEATGLTLFIVAHLKKAGGTGKSFEQGRMPSNSDLRGSAALYQLADATIGMGRDMEGGELTVDTCVLKNRKLGTTGPSGSMKYNTKTGRLDEAVAYGFEAEQQETTGGEEESDV